MKRGSGEFREFGICGSGGIRCKGKLSDRRWRGRSGRRRGIVGSGVDIQGRATSRAERGGKLGRSEWYGRRRKVRTGEGRRNTGEAGH